MKQFAVIGNPITHSLSPQLHSWVFKHLRIVADYEAINCTKEQLPKVIAKLRTGELNGINITLPLKQDVLPFLDVVDDDVKNIGAVNCIEFNNNKIIGHNTDWKGFSKAIQSNNIKICGRNAIVVGAGGVAKSVVYALSKSNIKKIFIINRTAEHAYKLIEEFKQIFTNIDIEFVQWYKISKNVLSQSIIINCTSIGMSPKVDENPVPKKYLFPSQTIIDTIYSPCQTKFCQIGESLGADTMSGLPMLIYQALASQEIWFNNPVSLKVPTDEIHKYLNSVIN